MALLLHCVWNLHGVFIWKMPRYRGTIPWNKTLNKEVKKRLYANMHEGLFPKNLIGWRKFICLPHSFLRKDNEYQQAADVPSKNCLNNNCPTENELSASSLVRVIENNLFSCWIYWRSFYYLMQHICSNSATVRRFSLGFYLVQFIWKMIRFQMFLVIFPYLYVSLRLLLRQLFQRKKNCRL